MPRVGPWRSWTTPTMSSSSSSAWPSTACAGIWAAKLRHPDYVRILCGTLDKSPQALAQLDPETFSGPLRLQRNNRDAGLRRRNRAWAKEA